MQERRSNTVTSAPYDLLTSLFREAGTLSAVVALLSWDQETMMPPAAAGFRAEELSLLSAMVHRKLTDPKIGDLLEACTTDSEIMSDSARSANIREIRRDYRRATRIPVSLVAEISETSSRALEVWKGARQEADFGAFRPWLQKHVELQRRKAECLGPPAGGELYDALMEEYEPGMTCGRIERIFEPLRGALTPLLEEVDGSSRHPAQSFHEATASVEAQQRMSKLVAEHIGFDFNSGRLDTSVHPFTEGLGPGDTRITTRYRRNHVADALSSTLHEAGHGLYEQNLPKEEYNGQPLAQAASLGIHESQSRLWENQVGRSRPFWEWAVPVARKILGPELEPFNADDAFHAINTVRPHLIRVESDEATYNLHIMLRYDLERAMFRGDLSVDDLPGAWNERIKRDLGLDVPDDGQGCLQDIHWAIGAYGYFPTYTLGNLYAAQLWEAAGGAIPDLTAGIAQGEFQPLVEWLRDNIHVHGRRYPATELVSRLTGEELSHAPLIRHLKGKLRDVYGIG